ncbi:Coproporphyrinogen III oxidase [Mycotypha africana]|uniref:Coproporphyrinogen III oxidase n=1 Tax=Mycotypha africana TaxID=64632 RepID=UPI00230058D2|nr:Coproporphyrinogen III oxidase [Mycotypha africana]KAI8991784.1 Coproporphyrinogen III oxidase [Mycotypha africana]
MFRGRALLLNSARVSRAATVNIRRQFSMTKTIVSNKSWRNKAAIGAIGVTTFALMWANANKVYCDVIGDDNQRRSEGPITDKDPMRLRMEAFIKGLQNRIVNDIEQLDGKQFTKTVWERPEGGEGITCVLQDGNVFEKAGVGVSIVYGQLPKAAVEQMRHDRGKEIDADGPVPFFAAGISLVIHPHNPNAPTVHLNYRYFEIENPDGTPKMWWFGGGSDLTPAYLYDEDAVHFHQTLKDGCDKFDKKYYSQFKQWCDKYFFIKHRGEARGVGGIFFDDLDDKPADELFNFVKEMGNRFSESYIPIVKRRMNMKYTKEMKDWQQIRRGRYVEFNLVWDRGTKFGLQTPGARIEAILMSLPLTSRWEYMKEVKDGSREQDLEEVLKNPRDWIPLE